MEQPLISVIIPNYNNEKYIVQCVNSVQLQTYKSLEIVIVDDCSTDKSLSYVDELGKKDERIRIILQKENHGVSHARNLGLKEAKGYYVTYLDGDDYYYEDKKIEREFRLLQENKNDEIIAFSQIIHVNEFGEKMKYQPHGKRSFGAIKPWLLTCNETGLYPRDYCIRKEILVNIGGYREDMNLFEDYELLLRLSEKSLFYMTDGIGTAYRIKDTGLSSQSVERLEKTRYQLFWTYVVTLPWIKRGPCILHKYSDACYRKLRSLVSKLLGRV